MKVTFNVYGSTADECSESASRIARDFLGSERYAQSVMKLEVVPRVERFGEEAPESWEAEVTVTAPDVVEDGA